MSIVSVLGVDPRAYVKHALHAEGSLWVEKNCYADLWIELLHAQRLDPLPLLAFSLALDFVGDQWTFFKPPHEDLHTLYGLDVQELNVWRTLAEHAALHLSAGRLVLTEADAFYLPDTAGTDYGRQHTKTTIALETLDVEARRLGYFHNSGYYTLEGADFDGVFRRGGTWDANVLPLFAEWVNLERLERHAPDELRARSRRLLAHHLRRRPTQNPCARFAERFGQDVDGLRTVGIDTYHAYAFATLRQVGANFELAAAYLRWLDGGASSGLVRAATELESISSAAKTLILKGARSVAARKPADFSELLGTMVTGWERGMAQLVSDAG
ncbi:DUF1839 domain-containing protein [Corallococcus sp. H22C18031201]|uniref:DUF1839 family protein n=1 Tax=Citreicoccus inhibens TaxID=2849499 RepID=UPI000E7698C0|nr:DUF1839 family protein [Citreicoccus inhibens]MBU8895178.1 DUF1839 family protein [Citreicoccus inhibens]RJS27316.1 DUF1839 domain-containing protein [Corallococcus sp. H22C18031201]